MRAAARSSRASSTRTPTSSSPAIGATSCAAGWPARPMRKSPPQGGGIVGDGDRRRARPPRRALVAGTRARLDEMLALRHDHLRGQERLRPDHRRRAEDAAGDRARSAADTSDRAVADVHGRARGARRVPRSPRRLRRADRRRDDSRRSRASGSPNGATSSARPACSRRTSRARSSRRARAAGLKPRIHADELARQRRSPVAAAMRRAVGGSSDLRRRDGIAGARRRRRRRDAAADRVVLPEARTVRAGADADRARRRRGARHRRQSRRRLLAVDAVRDDARLLRHGPDVRGGAGRARRSTPRARSIAQERVGSLEPGKQMDAVVVDGPAINLIRVGAPTDPAVDQARASRRRSTE